MYSYGPPTYGQAKAGRPARTYIQQLSEDTGCSPENLPEAMNNWEKWRERVRDIRASGTTWWWWWWSEIKTNHTWVSRCRLTGGLVSVTLLYIYTSYICVCVCARARACVCVCERERERERKRKQTNRLISRLCSQTYQAEEDISSLYVGFMT